MDTELDSRAPHLGLRDFLLYFVPGGVVLGSILIWSGTGTAELRAWQGFGGSIAGVFVSYVLGQIAYPLTYILKLLLRFLSPPQGDQMISRDEFESARISVIEKHPAYFAALIFRDRSLARFSLAMVVPTLLLGVALSRRLAQGVPWVTVAILAAGALSAAAFVWRYRHYRRRYRGQILRCVGYHWETAGWVAETQNESEFPRIGAEQ